jgi:hypothetical protein
VLNWFNISPLSNYIVIAINLIRNCNASPSKSIDVYKGRRNGVMVSFPTFLVISYISHSLCSVHFGNAPSPQPSQTKYCPVYTYASVNNYTDVVFLSLFLCIFFPLQNSFFVAQAYIWFKWSVKFSTHKIQSFSVPLCISILRSNWKDSNINNQMHKCPGRYGANPRRIGDRLVWVAR